MLQKIFLENLSAQLSDRLQNNIAVKQVQQVYGGDINETFVLTTSSDTYFLKVNNNAQQDMFEKEFNALQTLRRANTIHIPEPIIYGSLSPSIFLVMEYIGKAKPLENFW